MNLDVLEYGYENHVQRPQDKQRQTSENRVSQLCAGVVANHVSLHLDTIRCTAVGRDAPGPHGSEHVHGEGTVAEVALEIGRG